MQIISPSEEQCKRNFIQDDFTTQKIVNGGGNFVLNEVAKAEHTKRYVRSSATEVRCKKNSSERFHHQKIVNGGGNFVLNEVAEAEHTKRYVSISPSEEQCKIYPPERFFNCSLY